MLLLERDRCSGVGRRPRGIRRFEAVVEGMEGRRLMTGSGAAIFLSGATVEVIGTNLGDTGGVSLRDGSVEVKVSNAQGSDDVLFPASQVGSIQYFGGGGKNSFTNATSLTGYLYGGSGDNTLTGGSGLDFLYATSSGTNVLNAGSGFEILEALSSGNNTLNGGSGYDTMISFAGNAHIVVGSGYDLILAYGGHNIIEGGPGYATVYSFSTTDVINPNDRVTVYHFGY
jgi:Ca2+-binding RTX toxin-like protein